MYDKFETPEWAGDRDFWPTPPKALDMLVQHFIDWQIMPSAYIEPFFGNGAIIRGLQTACKKRGIGTPECVYASDLMPLPEPTTAIGAVDENDHGYVVARKRDIFGAPLQIELCEHQYDCIISNPPYTNTKASDYLLHRCIERCVFLAPTSWLLLKSTFASNVGSWHTNQSGMICPMQWCKSIVPVGRLNLVEGTKESGKHDFAWYEFSDTAFGRTRFYPRPNPQ